MCRQLRKARRRTTSFFLNRLVKLAPQLLNFPNRWGMQGPPVDRVNHIFETNIGKDEFKFSWLKISTYLPNYFGNSVGR